MSFYLGDCFRDIIFESALMIVLFCVCWVVVLRLWFIILIISCHVDIFIFIQLSFLISKSSLPVLSIWIGVCPVKTLSYCSLHAKFYSSKRWWWLLLHAHVCGVEMYAMFFCRENVCMILFSNCLRIWCIAELNS